MSFCNCMLTIIALLLMSARLSASTGTNLTECLQAAKLEFISPSFPNYTANSYTFNHRFLFSPVDIVFPTNAAGVAKAVECASNASVKIAARSGGHSYAANGAGGQNGSLVVDLKYLNSTTISGTTAKFGTGIRLGNLALALNASGRAMAHGTCPYVGSGGHLGCGGFGFPSRMWGLAIDAVIKAEVVLANGSIVNATAISTEHSDLFFAIRGASPSFGIVTSLTVNTQPAPSQNVVFNYTFSSLTPTNATDTFIAFQNFAKSNPPNKLGINARLSNHSFSFYGVYYASNESAFNTTIKPLLQGIPSGLENITTVGIYNWTGVLTKLAEGDNLDTTTKPDRIDTFYAKSLMITENDLLTNGTTASFFNYLYDAGNKTDTSWFVLADLWGGNNSMINNHTSNETAFFRRSTLYTFQFYASSKNSSPPFPPDGISFLNDMVDSVTGNKSATDFGMFGCYIDPGLSAADAHKVYYGNNTNRLESIKTLYDPNNRFTFPQAFNVSTFNGSH